MSKAETKSCIACAEDIKAEAILCKHCKTRQDEPTFLTKDSQRTKNVSKVEVRKTPNRIQVPESFLVQLANRIKPEFIAILGAAIVVGLVAIVPMLSEGARETKATITPKPNITFPERSTSASPSPMSDSSSENSNASSAQSSAPQNSTVTVPPSGQVSQPSTPTVVTVPLGSAITTPNFSLVINSVEILDQIGTVNGGALVAPPGTKLVLLSTTISIFGNAIDLSCASVSAIYTAGYDSSGAEMAHIWETRNIPGNPPCNQKTSAGETVSWNFAFKMSAGRTPAHISLWEDVNSPGAQEFRALLR